MRKIVHVSRRLSGPPLAAHHRELSECCLLSRSMSIAARTARSERRGCPPPATRDDQSRRLADAMDRVRPVAVHVAFQITRDPDLAEDIAQRALYRVWSRRSDWGDRAVLDGLVLITARNLALNAKRNARNRARILARIPTRGNAPPPSEILEAEQLKREFIRLLRAMPPRRRRIFNLRVCQGLPCAEVARRLGISRQSVANQLCAARRHLQSALLGSG